MFKLATFVILWLQPVTAKASLLPKQQYLLCIKKYNSMKCLMCVIKLSVKCNCYFALLNFKLKYLSTNV